MTYVRLFFLIIKQQFLKELRCCTRTARLVSTIVLFKFLALGRHVWEPVLLCIPSSYCDEICERKNCKTFLLALSLPHATIDCCMHSLHRNKKAFKVCNFCPDLINAYNWSNGIFNTIFFVCS